MRFTRSRQSGRLGHHKIDLADSVTGTVRQRAEGQIANVLSAKIRRP